MLQVDSLSVAYGNRPVLHKISLWVERGEILAIVGPNGAGKSTLMRAISGVLSPVSGSVRIADNDITSLRGKERARFLAVVPQTRDLPGPFSVYQTVLLGRTPYLGWLGRVSSADHEQVRWALEQTHLLDLEQRPVGELSGGEQQRVLLARALAQETPVLLLDEPTTHLDLEHQTRLLNLVCKMAEENQLTVLMALHDLNLAALYAQRVAIMAEGHIFAIGPPEQALTEDNLAKVYKVSVNVISHPVYGTPLILPDGFSQDQKLSAMSNLLTSRPNSATEKGF